VPKATPTEVSSNEPTVEENVFMTHLRSALRFSRKEQLQALNSLEEIKRVGAPGADKFGVFGGGWESERGKY
jgi:hypothetical protein